MNVAFGMKAHSGWAALVTVGKSYGDFVVVERRRIELVEQEWAKQPYHAAEDLQPQAARNLVKRAIDSVNRIAIREVRAAVKQEQARKNNVASCAVLVTDPMPDWTVEEILAVHFRMHKAEGVLFREALARAAKACDLRLISVSQKVLSKQAQQVFKTSADGLEARVKALGKRVGPPWGKDQKEAALAAMIALTDDSTNKPKR